MKKWGDLKQGDRVEWSYRHHLNSSSWTMITKVGTFIRLKKCKTIFGNIVEYSDAIVKFDGNKTNSTVYAPHLKRPLTDKTIDMNTIEGNKLIAIFMGGKLKPKDKGNHPDNPYNKPTWWGVGKYPEAGQFELQYHSSWDWLMPVVEEIWSLGGWEYCIFANGCTINGDHKSPPYISQTEGNTIEATHKAVIQFIQWYNQQKQ